MKWLLALLALVCGFGCAAHSKTARSRAEPGESRAVAWQSTLDRDHPLVGRIWDTRKQRFVGEAELRASVAASALVSIGEQHDNPDHHALQARLLGAMIASGRRPAVVFEMLDLEQQSAVERALAEHPSAPDALAAAVGWEKSGWPAFSLYRPVFRAALDARLPIVCAGIDRKLAMRIAHDEQAALDAELVRAFALDQPLAADEDARLRHEMADAHCGLLPESMLGAMVLVQRTRDARLAERTHAAAYGGRGAVLIAGNGHVRDDQGVPAALARAYRTPSLAVGLLEVEHGVTAPEAYARGFESERLPFAYVWFTPRVSDADRCAELRKRMSEHAAP